MRNIEKFLEFALQLVATETGFSFSYIQKIILRECLLENKKTYALLAEKNSYSESYIKFTVAPRLWLLLSQALGEKVNMMNILTVLEQRLEKLAAQDNPQTAKTTVVMPTAGFSVERYVLESPEGQVSLASSLYIERDRL